MFQLAYAFALKKKFNLDCDINLDIREYINYKIRSFELENFILSDFIFTDNHKYLKYDIPIKIYHLYQFIYKKIISRVGPLNLNYNLIRRGFIFGGPSSPLPKEIYTNDLYLYGYFQNQLPLESFRNELVNIFSLKYKLDIINEIPDKSIAVSIRMGKDYVNAWYPILSRKYYEDGIKKILENKEIEKIVVFSDYIDKVKEEKWFYDLSVDIVYINGHNPCEQIDIMKRCSDFVIANSSFSWWGAYLGSYNKDSIVISPTYWRKNEYTNNSSLCFKEMLFLENKKEYIIQNL